jgi:hypothetical protein
MKQKLHNNSLKISIVLFGLLLLLPLNSWAQENDVIVSNASFAEKIYLQLDRKVYTNGDTIWFKCIVSNASENIPSFLSTVLYVELIGADETIRQKKLIKIEHGMGQGNFDLDKKIPKGNYLIRAYTQWNQNFDTDFVFEEYIQVFTNDSQSKEAIENIKLIKEETGSDHLEVLFNPQVIDSLQKNKLIVYVTVDDKKDSLLLKKDKNDKYILDYDITKGSQFATLKIETENEKIVTKTVVLNKEYIDLQFFPESGQLVHGLTSKIAFKALDANGKGKVIEGAIIDEKQTVLAAFKSNSLGMGMFFIPNADSTKKYYARVTSSAVKDSSLTFQLPKVAATGTILSINKQGDKLFIKALSNYLQNDSIYLRISFRGITLYEKKVNLNQGLYSSLIATTDIPEGIVAFTLLDNAKNPMAERLYFNEKPEGRIQIKLSTDKEKYAKRELTNLNIETTNYGDEPIKANTSILVINKAELGSMQNLRQNILSYFLIDSELKGNIENPGYYFKNDNSTHYDLEALMLTQGWSKYNYSKPYQSLHFIPEKSLTVSGRVNSLFSEKKAKKDIQLTMMTYGKNKSFYQQVTDSLGKFNFNLNDEYGKEIEVLIQTAKISDKKTNNPVVIDQKTPPSISFEHNNAVEQIDSIVAPFIRKSMRQKEIDDKLEMQFGSIVLDQVNISAKMAPNKQKVTERYGKPKTVISGKEILSKEKKWSYGLYSVLLFNYPDKVTIERTSEQYLQAIVNNMPTVVIIDGIPVPFYDYVHIPSISPSEVSSFEIIEYAHGFAQLYCEVHPEIINCPPPGLAWGNVIAIYTHAGIGLFGAYKPKGLTKTTIPVFAPTKEFYAPKYENVQADDWQHPDLRTLIHWQPILKTDDLGKATTFYYNTDNKGETMIIVEAISDKGEIGYQELDYEINDQ